MSGFFSKTTFYQAVGYGLVGLLEWGMGFVIFAHLSFFPAWLSFGVQSVIVGATAFVIRKKWVFCA